MICPIEAKCLSRSNNPVLPMISSFFFYFFFSLGNQDGFDFDFDDKYMGKIFMGKLVRKER